MYTYKNLPFTAVWFICGPTTLTIIIIIIIIIIITSFTHCKIHSNEVQQL